MTKQMEDPFAMTAHGGDGRPADLDQVRRAIPLFYAAGDRHEVRALPGARSVVVSVDDLDAAVRAIADLDGTLYHCPNPIQPGARRANKKVVVKRRWIVVDVDPVRPDKTSATDGEKAAAARVVDAVLELLVGLGFPMPIVVDSGNGYHLCWRVDLPNDDLSQQIAKGFFRALADRCDTDGAKIDRGVHDAPHIFKLPGTWACKGPDAPDRPHRMSTIVYTPDSLDVVPVDLIKSLSPPPKPNASTTDAPGRPAPRPAADPFAMTVGEARLDNYVRGAVAREIAAVATTSVGGRVVQLNKSAHNLGLMAAWPEMDAAATLADLRRVALQAGLDGREADRAIRNGWAAGEAKGRPRPTPSPAPSGASTAAGPQSATARPKSPKRPETDLESHLSKLAGRSPVRYASTINPEFITFLWPGRIPSGKLTTFAGPGGVGKTFVLCDIAARVSAGLEWPFSGGEVAEPGDVLFVSGEDDLADTLVPRLIECGADRSRVAFLNDGYDDIFSLVDLRVLGMAVDALKAPRLVVVDPPTNFLDGVNDNRNVELRTAVLKPLAKFAATRSLSLILNHHTKKSTDELEAASMVMGSAAWVNAVRATYIFKRDQNDCDKVSISTIKYNVGKHPTTLTYSVVPTDGGLAKVEWLGEDDRTADEVTSGASAAKKTAGHRAAEWVTERFRERREWESTALKEAATEAGVSKNALFSEAVAALPIHKKKTTGSDGKVCWTWRAMEGWPPPTGDVAGSTPPDGGPPPPPDDGPPPGSVIGRIFPGR